MTEMEAIRSRHSVRSYLDRKIEKEKLDKLNALIDECNREGNLHLQLLEDAGNCFNRILGRLTGLSSAPSAIACVGKDDDTLDERAGYWGEKVVLYAQALGLNTCWVGMYKKDGVPCEVKPGEKLTLVIALGYGASQGKARKSKTAAQVSSCEGEAPDWFKKGVEAALLAPTAINQQRFMITLGKDGAVTFAAKDGPWTKLDLGIVKYHFEIGRNS